MSERQTVTDDAPKEVQFEAPKAELKPDNAKTCLYCGSEIARKAYVCPTCKYYQAAWKNSLIILGGLTGLLALILSSASFIWNNTIEIIAKSSWEKKVNIIDFVTGVFPEYVAVFSNSSVEQVYISEIVVYWDRGSFTLNVGKQIPSKEFLMVTRPELPAIESKVWKDYLIIANKNGIPNNVVLNNSTDSESDLEDGKKCFLAIFSTASRNQRMSNFYAQLRRVLVSKPIEAHLIYFRSATGEKIDVTFPAVVTFARSTNRACQSINIE